MKTKQFKERMGTFACLRANESFARSHTTPKNWVERIFKRAKVQLDEVIKLGYSNVWYDSQYADDEWRVELGWVAWTLNEIGIFDDFDKPRALRAQMNKIKDPYGVLERFLSK